MAIAFLGSRLLVWVVGAGSFAPSRSRATPRATAATSPGPGALGDTLAAPAVRWDATWYLDIARHGYRREAIEPAFFPLYSVLVRGLGEITRSEIFAAIAISLAAFAASLVLLHRLTTLELGSTWPGARSSCWPSSPPPCSSARSTRRRCSSSSSWGRSTGTPRALGRAGALGALGRPRRNTGWLIAPVLLALYLYGLRGDREPDVPGASGLRPRPHLRRDVLWIAVVPVGLFAYLAYMHIHSATGPRPTTPPEGLLSPELRRAVQRALAGRGEGLGRRARHPRRRRPVRARRAQDRAVPRRCGALGACVGVIRRLPAA